MPPDTQNQPSRDRERERDRDRDRESREKKDGSHHKERIGNYIVGAEIGRGSFATVYKGYRSKSRTPLAIKAVSRQKLTAKLLDNLESEINILKAINHKNIVGLQDCFKNDTHIYLVMDFCSGSDLSVYIKNRGKIPTLDFSPRHGLDAEKIFWPHPASGGIDERVTRCFLGQLAQALKFLRSQNLIHRDIKPQNLLLQPASSEEVSEGHPLGIPVLKVADFGFARILPAAAMAETLCGSPLYMAPEILRYEKYDATADLWSVGAVLFEMAVGKPPFRASNHVELLRRIEKGEDRIKFPDESSRSSADKDAIDPPPVPVSPDIKALIRALLKRQPGQRMGFEDFFRCGVWDGYMIESSEGEGDGNVGGSSSFEVSTDSSALDDSATRDRRIREMVASVEDSKERVIPTRAPQPIAVEPALNPQPAVKREDRIANRPLSSRQPSAIQPQAQLHPPAEEQKPARRSEPKYYAGDDLPSSPPSSAQAAPPSSFMKATPRPIASTDRASSARDREPASLEDPQPITPTSAPPPMAMRARVSGSPLAATPPITMVREETGKDESALDENDSVVGRDYVVVEKNQVEINALADELERASYKPQYLARRPSSRPSVVTRTVSAFEPGPSMPSVAPQPVPTPSPASQALIPMSYSPPFGLSTTPPFAIPPTARQTSNTVMARPPSIPQGMNVFPPVVPAYSPEAYNRYSTSPTSFQTGALARALTNTAIRIIGSSASSAATAIVRAASRRRPTIVRITEVDAAEDELLHKVEDSARKAFVLFDLAEQRLLIWQQLGRSLPAHPHGTGSTPPFTADGSRRKSSGSSANSEVNNLLRQQETCAGEAVMLFAKAMGFITRATGWIKEYVDGCRGYSEGPLSFENINPSPELVEIASWLRQRFNECLEKIEWAKERCADTLPFVDKLVHDRARELSRQAALLELQADHAPAEVGYENALWLLQVLLDDSWYDGGKIKDDDRVGVERLIVPIKSRLEALRKKIESPAV